MNSLDWFMQKKRFALIFIGSSGNACEVSRYYHPTSALEDLGTWALGGNERLLIVFEDDAKIGIPVLYAQSINHLEHGTISRPIMHVLTY